MNSTLYANPSPIIPVTGVNLTDKEGYLARNNSGAPAVNNSATVPAVAVILEGNAADKQSSLGLLGAIPGQVWLKAGGDITSFDRLAQKNDGTVITDPGTGGRVLIGTACENAVSGQLFRAITHAALTLS